MEKDYITERLKFLVEFFKLCWLSVFLVGGGTVSLLLGEFTPKRMVWIGAGALLTLVLLILLWHNHQKMLQLWEELCTGGPS